MMIGYSLQKKKALHKPAIITHDEVITYEQFTERVARIQSFYHDELLQENGMKIAIKLGNNPGFLEVFFASALLGYSCIPMDSKWTSDEEAYVRNSSKPDLIVTDEVLG